MCEWCPGWVGDKVERERVSASNVAQWGNKGERVRRGHLAVAGIQVPAALLVHNSHGRRHLRATPRGQRGPGRSFQVVTSPTTGALSQTQTHTPRYRRRHMQRMIHNTRRTFESSIRMIFTHTLSLSSTASPTASTLRATSTTDMPWLKGYSGEGCQVGRDTAQERAGPQNPRTGTGTVPTCAPGRADGSPA